MRRSLEAVSLLHEGNQRFVSGTPRRLDIDRHDRRTELVNGQEPFAVILGCADSRVPPEIVFDQGLGDLFVIRVAGNVAGEAEVGSVEFATAGLGARLVVVLGHEQCGAVQAAIGELLAPSDETSPAIHAMIKGVQDAVVGLLDTGLRHDREALEAAAVRTNVTATVEHLRNASPVLARRIEEGRLLIVGAEYLLETGEVEFFEGLPGRGA